MSLFSKDSKWVEAKKVIGSSNWIEVVSYYRYIGGENVFVYVIGDGNKKLIVDIMDDQNVLLIDKEGNPSIDTYDNVQNSRKMFRYSENTKVKKFTVQDQTFFVRMESKD
ncbi:portal protein [Bacillus phage Shbh1]|uniref:Uncharacterized protein n=1 Tax=Bacillus phage Shbh1 TaxID=1796992 RepID=A0A142F1D2_9CAUD|nr:portal protein [Bacillus phage Shbh1]AMQ66589.1 hypothetical protein [Bacillus phage Shbh1]